MQAIIAALAFVIIGYTVGSMKVVNESNEALVERLGRYHRKLGPGLNFVVPFVDTIVVEETTREQVLDIEPQMAITKDNVSLEADAVIFWRILDLERTFYEIDDIEIALRNLVLTTLRSTIAQLNLEDTIASRGEMNRALLQQLDEGTAIWGVKITRVEIQNIQPPQSVLKSMEEQRAAEIRRRASILEAEGEHEATILKARGTSMSVEILSKALGSKVDTKELLRYLIAQNYIDASYRLGESHNSKIVFLEPQRTSDAFGALLARLPEDMKETQMPDDEDDNGNGASDGKK